MTDFETKWTGERRKRWTYCVLGLIFTSAGVYWGGKLFELVLIEEEKILWRYTFLDEMYYTIHWSKWEEKWELIKLL